MEYLWLEDLEDSDEEDNEREDRVFRRRVDPFLEYRDKEFVKRYRLPKQAVRMLAERMIELGIMGPLHGIGTSISAQLTVCLGIRVLATGSMYREIGDSHGVGRSTVCRSVKRTLQLLMLVRNEYIRFPFTRREKMVQALNFARIADFPNVVGLVDGSHIPIKTPHEDGAAYRNRKGFRSINTMVIVDAAGRFIDVDPSWAGSTHDSLVWRSSVIGRAAENRGILEGFYLLGDKGYPLRPWLLTPYQHPQNEAEMNFNEAQTKTRSFIERVIGVWKMRFRCIDKTGGVLQSSPDRCSRIIMATAILHNIAVNYNVNLWDVEDEEHVLHVQPEEERHPEDMGDQRLRQRGELERNRLANNRFA